MMGRINYLRLIEDMWHNPGSEIYKMRETGIGRHAGGSWVDVTTIILSFLRSINPEIYRYKANPRGNLQRNIKNALQRASGTKLASSNRTHSSGLIIASYTYNGNHYTVQYWLNGSGRYRSTWLLIRGDE